MTVEDMIYTEDYYIDNTGKQIYEPVSRSINPVVLYADDKYANSAFEKMRLNLTLQEIYNLSNYGQLKIDVIEKNGTYLTDAEIAALYEMSYEELYAAYIALVYAAETYGAADYNPNAESTTVTEATPETTTSVSTTTTPVETTVADKTDVIYDKTDIVTTTEIVYDKTDIVTTTGIIYDKTDIVTNISKPQYGTADKTDIATSYDKTEPVITTTVSDTTITSDTTTTLPPETTTTTENITTTRPSAATTTSYDYDVEAETTSREPK